MEVGDATPASCCGFSPAGEYFWYAAGASVHVRDARGTSPSLALRSVRCADAVAAVRWAPGAALMLCEVPARCAVEVVDVASMDVVLRIDEGAAGLLRAGWVSPVVLYTINTAGTRLTLWHALDADCESVHLRHPKHTVPDALVTPAAEAGAFAVLGRDSGRDVLYIVEGVAPQAHEGGAPGGRQPRRLSAAVRAVALPTTDAQRVAFLPRGEAASDDAAPAGDADAFVVLDGHPTHARFVVVAVDGTLVFQSCSFGGVPAPPHAPPPPAERVLTHEVALCRTAISSASPPPPASPPRTDRGTAPPAGGVTAHALSPRGCFLYVGTAYGRVEVYDTLSWGLAAAVAPPAATVPTAYFEPSAPGVPYEGPVANAHVVGGDVVPSSRSRGAAAAAGAPPSGRVLLLACGGDVEAESYTAFVTAASPRTVWLIDNATLCLAAAVQQRQPVRDLQWRPVAGDAPPTLAFVCGGACLYFWQPAWCSYAALPPAAHAPFAPAQVQWRPVGTTEGARTMLLLHDPTSRSMSLALP
eukprot:TRINITY_DN28125_c0_g1_i1.p1 TRINITY_DN28125_c0_g1~~TRINITY_DN28125_c0_g1_i1.p1  ORF type:complete len:528 (+),score=121.80 TRINITY_DN28125_c0_g1_i1:57-1640(+)